MMALAVAATAAIVAALAAAYGLTLAVRFRQQWDASCTRAAISEAFTAAQRERMEFMEREFRESRGVLVAQALASESRAVAMTERLIETLASAQRAPEPVVADRTPAEPDAETRVREVVNIDAAAQNRAMQEERIGIGAAHIQDEYRKIGIPISLDEARLQAEAMLAGRSPLAEGAFT